MSASVRVRGIEHTGMIVRDTKTLSAWYRDTFAATVVSRSESDPPIIFLSFGAASLLELVPAASPEEAAPSDHVHLSLGVDDIEGSVTQLKTAGVALDREVFHAYDGSPVAFLRDPEGNLIQLVERVSDFPALW